MFAGAASNTPADWLATAVQHRFITAEQSVVLRDEARQRNVAPAMLAIEEGLLSAVQCDIVEVLADPAGVAPGYEIEDVVGHGGLGVVYRARQINLDRVVALKTVLVTRLDQPSTLARFRQEAQAIGNLRHPNIVTAFDYGTHHGRIFLAMEMVDGQDLAAFIKRSGSLDELQSLWIGRQVAGGLAHAAEHDVVHRDIKPGNLLLTDAPAGYPLPAGVPMAKITDFGLALLVADAADTRLTVAGTTMGTPLYMAPEQLSGSTVDCRADIYALGATLYHMVSGRAPFEGDSMAEIYANRFTGDGPPLGQLEGKISEAAVSLLETMLAVDPADRPSNYLTLLDRFDHVLAGLGSASIAARSSSAPVLRSPDAEDAAATPSAAAAAADVATVTQVRSTAAPAAVTAEFLPTARSSKLRKVVAIVVGFLLLACLAGYFATRGLQGVAPPQSPRLVSSGWEQPLFDGNTLGGWDPQFRGSWGQARDAEGGYVLEGRATPSRAARLTRNLPLPADRTLQSFRVRMGVDLRDAEAVELHFGHSRTAASRDQAAALYAVRLSDNKVMFGTIRADGETFERTSRPVDLPTNAAQKAVQYLQIRIDFHDAAWRVYLNDQLVGTAAASGTPGPPSISLVVKSGSAFFEALRLVELVEPPARD